MKKRTEKIEKIENLIKKNRYSRRKFMTSLGKKIALGAIATTGIASLISCEKENINKSNAQVKSALDDCVEAAIKCSNIFKCIAPGGGFICQTPFNCYEDNTCAPIICQIYGCSNGVAHQAGAGS